MNSIRLGRILVEEGHVDEGVKLMLEGMEAFKPVDEGFAYDYFRTLMAEAYLVAGRADEGLAILEGAIADCAAHGLRLCEAEMHRLKGELLVLAGTPESEIETCLHKAVSIAQGQKAKSWELRATTSLARLLKRQGKTGEARKMLSEIYGWFTEGFDTADLKDAGALLEELGR